MNSVAAMGIKPQMNRITSSNIRLWMVGGLAAGMEDFRNKSKKEDAKVKEEEKAQNALEAEAKKKQLWEDTLKTALEGHGITVVNGTLVAAGQPVTMTLQNGQQEQMTLSGLANLSYPLASQVADGKIVTSQAGAVSTTTLPAGSAENAIYKALAPSLGTIRFVKKEPAAG